MDLLEVCDLLYVAIYPEIFFHCTSDTQVIVRQTSKKLFIPDKNEIIVRNHRQAIASAKQLPTMAHADAKPNRNKRNPTAPSNCNLITNY